MWADSLSVHRNRQADQIALAAMHIVAIEGMSALTMSAIAEHASISRQTLYRYFPDVEAVLAAAMRLAAAAEVELEDIAAVGAPPEQLDAIVTKILESFHAGHPAPAMYEAALPPQARNLARDHMEKIEGHLIDIVASGVADGSFAADLTPEIDGPILYRLIIALYEIVAGAADPTAVIERARATARRLVGANA